MGHITILFYLGISRFDSASIPAVDFCAQGDLKRFIELLGTDAVKDSRVCHIPDQSLPSKSNENTLDLDTDHQISHDMYMEVTKANSAAKAPRPIFKRFWKKMMSDHGQGFTCPFLSGS